jgi:peroxiredoxin
VKLKDLLSEDLESSAQILALSVDAPEDLRRMIDRISGDDGRAPRFPFLTDPGHQVIDRYGLFNPDDPRGRQITHPATFVIDIDGVVRWKFVEVDYRVRPTNEDILAELTALEGMT